MAPYAVTPQAIAARADRDPKRMTWNIDKVRGIVWLDSPDLTPSHLELPLKPMLGCVAVAPARKEAIAAIAPGAFGGNMDYAGLNAGVKLMLPVNEPGALQPTPLVFRHVKKPFPYAPPTMNPPDF